MKGRTPTPLDPSLRLRAQVAILKEVAVDYSGRTIDNIIDNIEQRIKAIEEHERRENGLP